MEKQLTHESVRKQFNKTLNSHLNKALKSVLPTAAFKLDMVFIAMLVLLAERETEMQGQAEGDRFTNESLLKEISEMGFQTDSEARGVFEQLKGAGYVRVLEEGDLSATQPLLNMSRLLDGIFPKMPGINLVAYLVQTVEEVVSGRKDLQTANRQLDQVLGEHTRAVARGVENQGAGTDPIRHSKSDAFPSRQAPQEKKNGLAEEQKRAILRRLQAVSRSENPRAPQSAPRIISAGGALQGGRARQETTKPQTSGVLEEHPVPEERGAEEKAAITQAIASSDPGTAVKAVEAQSREDAPPQAGGLELGEFQTTHEDEEASEYKTPAESEEDASLGEEDIASRVAAFEEGLALSCPLCGAGKIEARETDMGKRFYECSQAGCYFISWGKPYHLPCPLCRNPFMIEALDSKNRPFLKCPRATCHHKQNLPGENGPLEMKIKPNDDSMGQGDSKPVRKARKRVVRRRVVRRRK